MYVVRNVYIIFKAINYKVNPMKNKLNFQTLLLMLISVAAMAISSTAAFASGGGGYGGGGGGFGGSVPQKRVVDQNYEQGKAIYTGRAVGSSKISYCVKERSEEGKLVPVKSKSIKAYKRTTYQELADNLYNCDEPESLVSSELKRDDYLYVMYYLNKRYRLALK